MSKLKIMYAKKFVTIMGAVMSIIFMLLFGALFLLAYFSPTKSLLLPINTYGEASIELIALLAVIATIICSSILAIKQAAGRW